MKEEKHYYGIRLKGDLYLQHAGRRGMKWGQHIFDQDHRPDGYIPHGAAYMNAEQKLAEAQAEENEEENDKEENEQQKKPGTYSEKLKNVKKKTVRGGNQKTEKRSSNSSGVGYTTSSRRAIPGSPKVGMVQTGSVANVVPSKLKRKLAVRKSLR